MRLLSRVLIVLVALEHVWFLVLEMFLFDKPTGLETFQMTQQFATEAKVLAANQGLYNGFLAAGLVWGLLARSRGLALQTFFLGCVIVAGLFGGATLGPPVAIFQAGPALLALGAAWLAERRGVSAARPASSSSASAS